MFGYEYQDYSFKGFAFNDAIEKNDYCEILKDGPELFGYLFLLSIVMHYLMNFNQIVNIINLNIKCQ